MKKHCGLGQLTVIAILCVIALLCGSGCRKPEELSPTRQILLVTAIPVTAAFAPAGLGMMALALN